MNCIYLWRIVWKEECYLEYGTDFEKGCRSEKSVVHENTYIYNDSMRLCEMIITMNTRILMTALDNFDPSVAAELNNLFFLRLWFLVMATKSGTSRYFTHDIGTG